MQTRTKLPHIVLLFVTFVLICLFLASPISALLKQTSPFLYFARGGVVGPSASTRLTRVPYKLVTNLSSANAGAFATNNSLALAPTVSGVSPSSVIAGSPGFILTVQGIDFLPEFVIRIDGVDRSTTFADATALTTTIDASEIATAGTFSVTVFDPTPDTGGESSPLIFNINNPVPTTSSLSPSSTTAGAAALTLTVTGVNFVSGAVVRFNGSNRATSFVNSTVLTAEITAADVAIGGDYAITVLNPTPGGGTSNAVNLTVNNPLPTLSSINPTSRSAGSGAFTLTVNGADFNSSSVVRFNGSNRTTTFVSSSQLSAQITAADIATAGTHPITVLNPTPGGGTSNSVDFTVNNPAPTLSSISPTSRTAGGAAFTLTVNGTNFNSSSVVRFNGNNRTTTLVSSTQMTAQILAADIATGGIYPITVFTPTPGGGVSGAVNLTVNNLAPTISSLSPNSVLAGSAAFTLTVNGTNFVSTSVVRFEGGDRTTTFVSSTRLTAQITASDIATANTYSIRVFNPTPGGGRSSSEDLVVNNPVPTLSSISPSTRTAGSGAFTLTVTGTKFVSDSIVTFDGSDRTTTFVSSTQLTAQIAASDIAAAGTHAIRVDNPSPGGGTSSAINLTVNNPVPTISSLSPSSTAVGGANFTLTVNGTNFISSSVVRFNGSNRTTTFVSATQLTAQIVATDIVNMGMFPITVSNPAPGGGVSNTVNLPVLPAITGLSPATVRAGGLGFTLTVSGTGFAVGSVVRFNGNNRSTTFLNSTTLTASIPATDISTVGTFPISVIRADGQTYSAMNLLVIPSLNNLTPLSTIAASSAFTLTLQGAGFLNGSVVQWNGTARPTTFVSGVKLTASISAADVAAPGPVPVSVLNPAPNSLTSNPVSFIVSDPPPANECPAGADITLANPGLVNSGPARAQMWQTDDNIWWGAFSNNTDGIYFYKRTNPTTWTKGDLIDANFVAGIFTAGAPDCLWTGTNLFILIQENQILARLYKYDYDSTTQTFSQVAGFPVNLPLTGIGTSGSGKVYGTLSIEQDSTGKLWASYTGGGIGGDGNMRVIWSTSADHTQWDTNGFILASGLSILKTEGAAIVRFGGNKIGVAWSNLNATENAFRFHNDADLPTTWSAKEVIDSGLGPEGTGPVSGKQMTMKAHPDGRIFMVSDDNDGINNHLHLYIRTVAGAWGAKTLVVNNFTAMPSKPVLLLDTDNSTVHVVYKDGAVTSNGLTGQTFIAQASMNNPAFNTACLFLDTSDNAGIQSTSNPTSTKQSVNATSDLVVAASTGKAGNRILTNMVDLTPNVLTVFSISPKEVDPPCW